ncbi:hypothetical protein V7O62_04565 [Methanolobus sp. ZRKC2]|uniref:hypothetical protein n=1 Tax=Methanolobus sp. ZRKC2 TaxID=3125783 RepID=UPI00325034ED
MDKMGGITMKKTLLTLLLLMTIFMQPASADVFNEIDMMVNEYNENTDHVPSLLKNTLGNEVIYLLIEMDDGSKLHIKAVTENALITTFEEFDPENNIEATVKVTVKENTVYELLASEKPLESFSDALESENIIVEPIGLVGTIKFQVANVLFKLSDFLGIA